jgi:lycopene cyclase domain-containing protein
MFLGLSYYFWLLIIALSLPLCFRVFHPTDPLRENRWAIYVVLLLTTAVFGLWDVVATWRGHWDFNSQFVWDLRIWGLPLEEWLFYPVVVYASLLIWSVLRKYDSWHQVWPGLRRHFVDGRLPWGLIGLKKPGRRRL